MLIAFNSFLLCFFKYSMQKSLWHQDNKNKSKYIYIEALVHINTGYKENRSIKMKNISIENNYNYKEC